MVAINLHNICSNNCQFAKKSTMLGYGGKQGDTYIDAIYMWRCMKIEQLITTDSVVNKLGCASYSNIRQNDAEEAAADLINAVDKKLEELAEKGIIPAPTTEPELTPITQEPSLTVVSKPEPGDIPINQVAVEKVAAPVVEPKKRKTKVAPDPSVEPKVEPLGTQGLSPGGSAYSTSGNPLIDQK